jgi:hypothetical protein
MGSSERATGSSSVATDHSPDPVGDGIGSCGDDGS